MKKSVWILSVLMALAFIGSGCGRGKPSANAANKAFATADAETKATWDKAMAAASTNGYVQSIVLFRSLSPQPNLNEAQKVAVAGMLAEVNQKMFDAANKGDPEAEKAMEELKQFRNR